MSFGYTTSSAESAPRYGPTAHDRRRAYEDRHPDAYFIFPDKSESGEWECWQAARSEADDVLVDRYTSLTGLLGRLESQETLGISG